MRSSMRTVIFNAALAGLFMILTLAVPGRAAMPGLINFQGKLADSSGRPITSAVPMMFKFYAAVSSGAPVWTETQNVTPDIYGIYSVMLGEVAPFNIDFSNEYWLGVTVGTDSEMLPRYRIGASAYSLYSLKSATAAWAAGADWTTITSTAAVTAQGNAFNGSGQLVQLLGDGKLPVLNGSNLTGLPTAFLADGSVTTVKLADNSVTNAKVSLSTAAISSGKFGDDRVAISTQSVSGGIYNAAGRLVQMGPDGFLPALNGSNLTSLTKTQVGLGSVDNTSDAAKPVSTAQQTALNLKANLAGATFTGAIAAANLSGTNTGDETAVTIKSALGAATSLADGYLTSIDWAAFNNKLEANGNGSLLTSLTAGQVGLGSVTNTSDADKPVSTAQQTALNLKANLAGATFTGAVAATNLSGTNTGDDAVNSLYSGLVSNAVHTGDATGATALTVVKINGTQLSALATGILKNTTGTGVPSIAVAADFPPLNQDTTGNAATATTLTGLTATVANLNTVNGPLGTAAFTDSGSYATAAQGVKADAALPSASFTDAAVTGKLITGYTGAAGIISGADSVLGAINKLSGNIAANGNGTVTGVTGTAPVSSSGGTAPVISMAAASSGVDGYMTGAYASKLDGIAAYTADETSLHLAGTVFSALGSSVTLLGNTFNGNNQLLQLDGTAKVPYANINIGQAANTVAAGDDSRFHAPLTVAAIGAAPNADGLTLTAQQLNLQPASASFGGVVTTAAQTFAGAKTFSEAITGPTVTNTVNNLVINAGALSGITTLAMNDQLTNSYASQAALNLTGAGAGISFAGTGPNKIVTASGVDLALMPGGAGKVGIGTQVPNSTLQVSGSFAFKTTLVTASSDPYLYTLTDADCIVFANSTAGVTKITLPSAVGLAGRMYTVVHTLGGPTVTVYAAGSELINDAAFKDLPTRPNEVTIVSDGAKWWILSNYLTP